MATQSAPSSSNISPPPPPPPPPPPKESLGRRYKYIWPILLAVNISIGAYLFMRTKEEKKEEEVPAATVTSTPTSTASVTPSPPAIPEPVKSIPKPVKLIPEDQQRELFKWMLEEKRKVRTKDPQEKKRIDEEKAILKQFIRAKSIPSL